jgi:hypothetical protein
MEVNGQLLARPLYPVENNTEYPLNRIVVDPRAGLEVMSKRKSVLLAGIEPQFSIP